MALALCTWAPRALACCGNEQTQLESTRSLLVAEALVAALSALAAFVAVSRRRWWLAAAFAGLLVTVPQAIMLQANGCGGASLTMWRMEVGLLLYLGPLSHRPGERWSAGAGLAFLTLCGALVVADWSRESFSPNWFQRIPSVAVLSVPAWAAWLWLTTWILTRPLLRAFGGWRSHSLVERRLLAVSLIGGAPLAFMVLAYASLFVGESIRSFPGSLQLVGKLLRWLT
jgi:hypothetical protein